MRIGGLARACTRWLAISRILVTAVPRTCSTRVSVSSERSRSIACTEWIVPTVAITGSTAAKNASISDCSPPMRRMISSS